MMSSNMCFIDYLVTILTSALPRSILLPQIHKTPYCPHHMSIYLCTQYLIILMLYPYNSIILYIHSLVIRVILTSALVSFTWLTCLQTTIIHCPAVLKSVTAFLILKLNCLVGKSRISSDSKNCSSIYVNHKYLLSRHSIT